MSRKLWVKDGKLLTCNGALVFADVCPCRKVYLRMTVTAHFTDQWTFTQDPRGFAATLDFPDVRSLEIVSGSESRSTNVTSVTLTPSPYYAELGLVIMTNLAHQQVSTEWTSFIVKVRPYDPAAYDPDYYQPVIASWQPYNDPADLDDPQLSWEVVDPNDLEFE